MKLGILIFKNGAIDCFTTPQFIDIDPFKAAEQLKRSILMAVDSKDLSKVIPYRNLSLYNFGEFDDNTGKMDILEEPQLIFDVAQFIDELGVFKEEQNA